MEKNLQAYYVALGGIRLASQLLDEDNSLSFDGLGEAWSNNQGLFFDHPLGEGRFTVRIPNENMPVSASSPGYGLVDEERKVNVNNADVEILQNLLKGVGHLQEGDAEAVANAIADWRDEDEERREGGAEDYDYQGLTNAYESKDAPFESLEELLLVKGMTPELFKTLSPYLSAHGSGKINVNTSPPQVLFALGLSEQGVDQMVAYRMGEDGMEGTGDDHVFSSVASIVSELNAHLPKEDLNRLTHWVEANQLTVRSEAFQLSIEATAKGMKEPMRVRCILDRDGKIKEWTEE